MIDAARCVLHDVLHVFCSAFMELGFVRFGSPWASSCAYIIRVQYSISSSGVTLPRDPKTAPIYFRISESADGDILFTNAANRKRDILKSHFRV